MSMIVSFCAVIFPRDVLDEILNLIESGSEGFPTYSLEILAPWFANMHATGSLLTIYFLAQNNSL